MRGPRRKISAGTVLVLLSTILILGGTGYVLSRIGTGAPIDLSRLQPETVNLQETPVPSPEETPAAATAVPDLPARTPAPSAEPAAAERSFTLTVAGTVCLSGEVRKNSYFSDVKQYDYYDTMMLLKKEISSDLNIVFLENLLADSGNATDVTAPEAGAAMLGRAGFQAAACGFAKAFDKGEEGIQATGRILKEQGVTPLGIYGSDEEEHFHLSEINGIRTAMIQYTNTVASGTRKNMAKKGLDHLVPAADGETAAADIARARGQGAEVVLVLMNWGTTGKAPDKAMRTLAQALADAGADMIIGCGSRIVSGAEMLTAAGTGRQVLCVWSLGTVLSGDRSNIKRIAGMLLQATVRAENGNAEIREIRYIPVYTWKYKQDGRFQYRCLAADGNVPDGMDSEQQKMMKKAAETVRTAMKDSPAEARSHE